MSEADLLLMAAIEKDKEAARMGLGAGAGATLGGLVGFTLGSIPHQIGRGVNAGRDALAAAQGLTPVRRPLSRVKPGFRAAGMFPLAAIGGILGGEMQRRSVQESPEAMLLARRLAGAEQPGDRELMAGLIQSQLTNLS